MANRWTGERGQTPEGVPTPEEEAAMQEAAETARRELAQKVGELIDKKTSEEAKKPDETQE